MPKSKFNKDKANFRKEAKAMSQKERDKVKDIDQRLAIAKEQEKSRHRVITPEMLEKEKAEKNKPTGKGVTIKVKPRAIQPKSTSSGSTQTSKGAEKKSTGKKSSGSTHKSSKSKKSSAERKAQTEKLKQYREQLSVLVDEANSRVSRLSKMKRVESRALDEARRTLPTSRDENGDLFTANLRTEAQITRELSRVMAFLGDFTSLARGAENFTEDLSSAGLFGGQFRADGGPGYDTSVVDPEVGDKVFDIYHRVLEIEGGWSRVMGYFHANSGGLVEYGSENIINAIYDMVENFGTSDKATEKIINRATTMIEDMISSYEDMAVKQRSGVDYGFIGFDATAEDRRKHWEWEQRKAGIL